MKDRVVNWYIGMYVLVAVIAVTLLVTPFNSIDPVSLPKLSLLAVLSFIAVGFALSKVDFLKAKANRTVLLIIGFFIAQLFIVLLIDSRDFSEFVKATREPIEFATPASRTRGISHASVVGAIASAWYTQDRDALSRFRHVLCDGTGAMKDEQAAIRLREFLLTTKLTQGGIGARHEVFVRSCTALRAFLEGRSIQKLYCREEAVFMIPDIAVV